MSYVITWINPYTHTKIIDIVSDNWLDTFIRNVGGRIIRVSVYNERIK